MSNFDLVVKGGLTVTTDGVAERDIGVRHGQIAAITAAGVLDTVTGDTLDAQGMIVVPGGIDPHIHGNFRPPNAPADTPVMGPPDVLSKAALWGGTTTLIDFSWVEPAGSIQEAIEQSLESWSASSCCDFSFHVLVRGQLEPTTLAEVPDAVVAGFPSFKVFTTNVFPNHLPLKISLGSLWELFQITAANSGIVAVHAEDDELVMYMYDKLNREKKTHYIHMPLVHSTLSEDLAFRRVIRLAQRVPGTALYMMHVSAADGVAAVAEARDQRLPVYAETLHHYALRTEADYRQPDGMIHHTYPALQSKADTEAIWDGVASGDIATFATDAVCTTYALKTAADQIDTVIGGSVGIEPRMVIVYTEMVVRRGMGLDRFVDATATNAARILGLYPQKGVIAVGSDADLAIFDPRAGREITASLLHESDYTPWEGWRVEAWPVATVLRGKVVMKEGKFLGAPGDGHLVKRKLDPAVQDGRAVR